MEEFKEDIIYILLVFINFLFIFNFMKFAYTILDFRYLISFGYVLIAVIIFLALKYLMKKIYLKILFLSVMLISLFLYFYYNRIWIINRVAADFNIINDNISNSQPISLKNLYIILIIIIPLVVIAMFLYNRGIYTSVLFLTLTFMLFLWYTGYTKETIEYLFKYTFLNVFTLVVINYIKNRKMFRKKDVKIETSIFIILIYGIIIAVVFASIIRMLPKEYYGRLNSDSYSYFQNKFEKTKAKVTISEKYNISYSGYNDSNTSLGGSIKLDKSKVLEVYGGQFLYLRGNVKDYYTGNSWLSENNSYRNSNENVIYNSGLRNFSISTVTIKPLGLTTSTVFAPPAAIKIDNGDKQVFADSYGCFLREKPYDTEYTISYYNGFKLVDEYKDLKTDGSESIAKVEANYLQIPDTVPQEVYNLVDSITQKSKAASNYDKVICLKKYLEQNYKYTLNTKELPAGEDFVDNFLFKEKQGYCTYFASALAIMCRISGVPAIYVEGFKQSASPIVTNDMAHAWVEVNLTGDDIWLIADPSPTAYQENTENINNPSSENNNTNAPVKSNQNNRSNNENQNNSNSEKAVTLSKNMVIIILIIFSAVVLILARVLFILVRKRIIINNKSVIPLMMYSIKRLKSLGIKKGETEGFLEFSERVKDAKLRNNMILLSKCYNREAYGNRKSKIDKKEIYKFIEKNIRNEKGFKKYYIDKFLR